MKNSEKEKMANDSDSEAINAEQIPSNAEGGLSKKKIALGAAIGVAAIAAGIGIGFFVGRKLDLKPLAASLPSAGTKSAAAGAVEAACEAVEAPAAEAAVQAVKQVKVDWHPRKLPVNQNASSQALAYAESVGVKLGKGQTIVRPQIRHYKQVA